MGSLGSAEDKKQLRAGWRCLAAGTRAETTVAAEPCGTGHRQSFTEGRPGARSAEEKAHFGLVSASVAEALSLGASVIWAPGRTKGKEG